MEKPNKTDVESYGRALEAYDDAEMHEILGNLGLSERDIVGKTMLDIGSGGGEFARWGNRHGARVIALDHQLEDNVKRRMEFAESPFVMGTAHALPFADGSFDLVVSHASMPNITVKRPDTSNREEVIRLETESRLKAVQEALRVVRTDGEVRLAPVRLMKSGTKETWQSESLRKVLETLETNPELEVETTSLPSVPGIEDSNDIDWTRLVIRHRRVIP